LVWAVTAFFRRPVIKRVPTHYRGWRYFHGGLAVVFTVLALWHSIDLGRHTDMPMSALYLALALIGFAMLANLYQGARPHDPKAQTKKSGAAS
jgi:predicted ferric reductase